MHSVLYCVPNKTAVSSKWQSVWFKRLCLTFQSCYNGVHKLVRIKSVPCFMSEVNTRSYT